MSDLYDPETLNYRFRPHMVALLNVTVMPNHGHSSKDDSASDDEQKGEKHSH